MVIDYPLTPRPCPPEALPVEEGEDEVNQGAILRSLFGP